MNRRLSEERIRSTCRELVAARSVVSGRALRQELRDRFGAVGKTARVFQIWREEARAHPLSSPTIPADVTELQRRLVVAEAAAKGNLDRAELAELREQAHQDHWAQEIDRLRQELEGRPKFAAEIRTLQERVMRLTVELAAAKAIQRTAQQG